MLIIYCEITSSFFLKKFLYANKGSPARLNSVNLKHYIKTVERIEQKIAYKKDKLKLHFEKWDCIKSVL